MAQCQCLTKCGQQCKNSAKSGSNFCATHKNCGQVVKKDQIDSSSEVRDSISIINISGTDPTKETQVKVYLCKHELVNAKIRSILMDLYQEFIDYIDVDSDYDDLKKEYQKRLRALQKAPTADYADMELPYDPIIKSQIKPPTGKGPTYNPATGLYNSFSWKHGDLVALDYHTSYDRHYYMDIQEDIKDEIDIVVHEH